MEKTLIQVGPADHGRTMSLDEFDHAEVREGYRYELGRGVVQVAEVPGKRHLSQVNVINRQLRLYEGAHAGVIHTIAAGSDCKILITAFQSERHPDQAIYLNPPPDEDDFWASWIPGIVIEVVSPGSEQRDYVEKREEYLAFGVLEYWIIDADKQQMVVLRRSRGQWLEQVVRPPQTYRTHLLPGFELDLAAVFSAPEAKL